MQAGEKVSLSLVIDYNHGKMLVRVNAALTSVDVETWEMVGLHQRRAVEEPVGVILTGICKIYRGVDLKLAPSRRTHVLGLLTAHWSEHTYYGQRLIVLVRSREEDAMTIQLPP